MKTSRKKTTNRQKRKPSASRTDIAVVESRRNALVEKYRKTSSRSGRPHARTKKPKYKHNRAEFGSPQYNKFIEEVKRRDHCRCQMPGCKRHTFGIEVHHIIQRSVAPALMFFSSNGICLCSRCHAKVTGNEAAYAGLFQCIVMQNLAKQQ